jgi:hypothetical protein
MLLPDMEAQCCNEGLACCLPESTMRDGVAMEYQGGLRQCSERGVAGGWGFFYVLRGHVSSGSIGHRGF